MCYTKVKMSPRKVQESGQTTNHEPKRGSPNRNHVKLNDNHINQKQVSVRKGIYVLLIKRI
jgi:hypothetical protein